MERVQGRTEIRNLKNTRFEERQTQDYLALRDQWKCTSESLTGLKRTAAKRKRFICSAYPLWTGQQEAVLITGEKKGKKKEICGKQNFAFREDSEGLKKVGNTFASGP